IAVEDTSMTGASVLTAFDALRGSGADEAAVSAIIDRDTRADDRVEETEPPYLTALTIADPRLDCGAAGRGRGPVARLRAGPESSAFAGSMRTHRSRPGTRLAIRSKSRSWFETRL